MADATGGWDDDKWDREILRKVDGDMHAGAASRERFAEATAARAERFGAAAALASGHTDDLVGGVKFELADIVGKSATAAALAAAYTDNKVGLGFDRLGESVAGHAAGVKASVVHGSERASDNFAALSVQVQTLSAAVALADKNREVSEKLLTIEIREQGSRTLAAIAESSKEQALAMKDAAILALTQSKENALIAKDAEIRGAKCCCETEQQIEGLKVEMLRLQTFRIVPGTAATTGGVFPTGG